MRYYPCKELYLTDIRNRLSNMVLQEKEEIWLLSLRGVYRYFKDDMLIYKLNLNNNDRVLKNYLDDIDFLVSANTWKKIETRHHIPPNHCKVSVKTCTFSPNSKSKFKFVVEMYGTGKTDYYFTSPEDPENLLLMADIRSFLSALT